MLICGDYSCIDYARCKIDNLKVYNFSSLVQGYTQLTNLLPGKGVYSVSKYDDNDFDVAYCDYILNNDDIFLSFMAIVLGLYEGQDIFLVVTRNEFYDYITESLLNIIKVRYGYCGFMINDREDIDNIDYDIGKFTYYGLILLDNDRLTFMSILGARGLIKEEDYD